MLVLFYKECIWKVLSCNFCLQTSVLRAHLCEPSSLHAITILYGALLVLLTYLRVCSAFYFTIWLLFSLIFRHFLWGRLLQPQLAQSSLYHSTFIVCETLSLSIPFILSIIIDISLIDFFVPLTGRSGGHLPPDLLIAVTVAFLTCITFTLVVS